MRFYLMRLKCLLYNKENIFWTLFFPIGLAIIFQLALTNVTSSENFKLIKVGIVKTDDTNYTNILNLMKEVTLDSGEKMFQVTEFDLEKADQALEEKAIEGYIIADKKMRLVVAESGIGQTIIKTFLESYEQIGRTLTTIITDNHAIYMNLTEQEYLNQVEVLMNEFLNERDYINDNLGSSKNPNVVLNYFYALIAMACLFGSFWGFQEILEIQADQSSTGARINVAPIHKMKLLFCNLAAAYTIHLVDMILLLTFLKYALKIDFGNNTAYLFLACMVSCATAIALGAMITILVKGEKDKKNSILTAISLLGSFLSGLMIVEMKYLVAIHAPWLSYINPASLISDMFYSLYYYEDYTKYFINIGLLLLFTTIFGSITYIKARGQQYASI